jgi:predicted nucleotidyltransferase
MAEARTRLHPEAEAIVDKAIQILRRHGASEVYAFGSVVTDRWSPPESDLDLAVRGVPCRVFYRAVGDLLWELDCSVDVIDLDVDRRFGDSLRERGALVRVG